MAYTEADTKATSGAPSEARTLGQARCVVLAGLLAAASGCALPPQGQHAGDRMPWPYAGVTAVDRLPFEYQNQPMFMGRWIASEPGGGSAYTETSEPRYVARVPFGSPSSMRFLDLGPGAEVENIAFPERGGSAFLVAAIVSPHHGRAVTARALLVVDLATSVLLDSHPLPRLGFARGFVLDERRRTAYLLEDDGEGSARATRLDLQSGRIAARRETGHVPAEVSRKGLALEREGRFLFCLAGGAIGPPTDFLPVDLEAVETGPEVLVLDTDSLGVHARYPLEGPMAPVAIASDPDQNRVYVLESTAGRSRLLVLDSAFFEPRGTIDFPEETTDLVVAAGYAFAPGPHGIYIADLTLQSWVSRSAIPLELTGEVAVSSDLTTALVLFQSAQVGGPPGIATVELTTGRLLEVVR